MLNSSDADLVDEYVALLSQLSRKAQLGVDVKSKVEYTIRMAISRFKTISSDSHEIYVDFFRRQVASRAIAARDGQPHVKETFEYALSLLAE